MDKSGGIPPAEFAQQVEQEIPFLRRVVRRWHRQGADADDLVQDTLVRALSNAHLWAPGSCLRGWLLAIMRNQFFASLAKRSRSVGAYEAYAATNPTESMHDGEDRLTLRDVDEVLDRLPSKQRSAVLMVGIEGRSYKQVALAIGGSVDAIRCDLARARSRLRQAVYPNQQPKMPSPFVARGARQLAAAAQRPAYQKAAV